VAAPLQAAQLVTCFIKEWHRCLDCDAEEGVKHATCPKHDR